jgi:hypothetical protein
VLVSTNGLDTLPIAKINVLYLMELFAEELMKTKNVAAVENAN